MRKNGDLSDREQGMLLAPDKLLVYWDFPIQTSQWFTEWCKGVGYFLSTLWVPWNQLDIV